MPLHTCCLTLLPSLQRMDTLFEASFSPLASSGKVLSQCGKCRRYMKLIASRPSRLYCPTCEDVYGMPQVRQRGSWGAPLHPQCVYSGLASRQMVPVQLAQHAPRQASPPACFQRTAPLGPSDSPGRHHQAVQRAHLPA